MTDLIGEPGVWVLAAFLAFGLVNLVAAILLRPARRRFLDIVRELSSDPMLTEADKAWIRDDIETTRSRALLIASPFAPGAILGAVALGILDGWHAREHGDLLDLTAQAERIEKSADRMTAKALELSSGIDPRKGAFWKDPRRKEMEDLAHTIEMWSHPVAMLWVILWLVGSLPLLVAGYLISGSIQPFVKNLWEPIRAPIAATLRLRTH